MHRKYKPNITRAIETSQFSHLDERSALTALKSLRFTLEDLETRIAKARIECYWIDPEEYPNLTPQQIHNRRLRAETTYKNLMRQHLQKHQDYMSCLHAWQDKVSPHQTQAATVSQ